jgi:hypothetical protein
MKKIHILFLGIIFLFSCSKEDFTYNGSAYIQFSKTEENIDLKPNSSAFSFEINTVANNETEDLITNLVVDTEKSDLELGKHFEFENSELKITQGDYIANFNIRFLYENFNASQIGNLYLNLKENNTKIGSKPSLHIKVTQKDWMKDLLGKYKFSYHAKSKEQSGELKITEVYKQKESDKYVMKLVGLPVWTFSAGARQYPDTLALSFSTYKFEDKVIFYKDKILADYAKYRKWLASFNYGDLSIKSGKDNRWIKNTESFVLNYKIHLGNSTADFENVNLKKLK